MTRLARDVSDLLGEFKTFNENFNRARQQQHNQMDNSQALAKMNSEIKQLQGQIQGLSTQNTQHTYSHNTVPYAQPISYQNVVPTPVAQPAPISQQAPNFVNDANSFMQQMMQFLEYKKKS